MTLANYYHPGEPRDVKKYSQLALCVTVFKHFANGFCGIAFSWFPFSATFFMEHCKLMTSLLLQRLDEILIFNASDLAKVCKIIVGVKTK